MTSLAGSASNPRARTATPNTTIVMITPATPLPTASAVVTGA